MEIITTKPSRPPVMIVYGDHKVGKSTFAASCPKAIFLQVEDGLQNLSVQAFELATTTQDIFAKLDWLATAEHEFKTLVVDSLDWCERVFWQDICREEGWAQIGDGPYGAGYKLAIGKWKAFIEKVQKLNQSRKMMIVLIAHAKIMKFEDPERDNYDRYDLDLHEKSGNLLCQFADIIGFAALKVAQTKKQDGMKESVKIRSTDERVLNLAKRAAFEAGNRYGLPPVVALSWAALAQAFKDRPKPEAPGNLTPVKEEKAAAEVDKVTAEPKAPAAERIAALKEQIKEGA